MIREADPACLRQRERAKLSTRREAASSDRVVILAHACARSAPPSLDRNGGDPTPWVFLGEDYLTLLAWQRQLGDGFRRIPIARQLDEVARRSRRAFLDLIAELGHRHTSLAWWMSRISERNTMVSPLFLHCCHLQVGLSLMERSTSPTIFVSQSWAVLDQLARTAQENGHPVRWQARPPSHGSEQLRRTWQILHGAVRFFKRRMIASRVARRITNDVEPPRSDRPLAILRTFIDEGSLAADGTFRDRHLPGVCAWLEGQGYDVRTIPLLYNMKRTYRETWDWLNKSRQQFLNPDSFYRLGDVLRTLVTALRQTSMPAGPIRLNGCDVTAIFEEERRRIAFEPDGLRWLLLARLPRRLKQAGLSPDLLLQGYENMIPEKALILGFRRHLPRARIVGFQHPIPPPMLLCHFVTSAEAELAPLPDRIVCNGVLLRDVMIREGLDPERVVDGPALRFAHLWQAAAPDADSADEPSRILVALPLELGAAVEVFSKVLAALSDLPDVPVRIKPHPMMNRDALLQESRVERLPDHFEFVDGPMATWLASARVVVSAGSAVLYEAAAAGVPAVAVGREGGLNLSPTDWLSKPTPLCHGPEDIRSQVQSLLRLSGHELAQRRQRGVAIKRDSFNVASEENMRVFLDAPPARCPILTDLSANRNMWNSNGLGAS